MLLIYSESPVTDPKYAASMWPAYSVTISRLFHESKLQVKGLGTARRGRLKHHVPKMVLLKVLEGTALKAPSSLSTANAWSKNSYLHCAEEDTGTSSFRCKLHFYARKGPCSSWMSLQIHKLERQHSEGVENSSFRVRQPELKSYSCLCVTLCKSLKHAEFWFLNL